MPGRPLVIVKVGDKLPTLRHVTGDFEDWIMQHAGIDPAEVRIVDPRPPGTPLPDPGKITGAIITGSSAMVTDRSPWMRTTGQWLMQLVNSNKPLLGICFGHQLLADLLGGRVDDNPRGVEVGTVNIRLGPDAQHDPLLNGLGDTLTAQASHRQSVLSLPPGATGLAATTMDEFHGFRVGDRVWGLQFHPEFNAEVTREYIAYYKDDLGASRCTTLQQAARDDSRQHRPLQQFAKLLG